MIIALAVLSGPLTPSIAEEPDKKQWRLSASAVAGKSSTVAYSERFVAPLESYGRLIDRRVIRTTHQQKITNGKRTNTVEHVFLSDYSKRKQVVEKVTLERDGEHWRLLEHVVDMNP